MKNHFMRIQRQANLLAEHARRLQQARMDLTALLQRAIHQEPASYIIVYILTLFLYLAGFGLDILILRAVAEYLANNTAGNLAGIAVLAVPFIVLIAELYLAVCITRAIRESDLLITDSGSSHRPMYRGVSLTTLRLISGGVLLIQPVSAYATYKALVLAAPEMHDANTTLLHFLVLAAVCFHALILTSGPQILSFAEAVKEWYNQHKERKLTRRVATQQRQLVMGSGIYDQLVGEYATQYPNAPAPPPLDPITMNELNIINLQTSNNQPPSAPATSGNSPYPQN